MGYAFLADAAMVAHAAFLAYLLLGGFLAWRWRHAIVPHVLVAAWGFGSVVIGYACPITAVENWARARAGEAELPATGFIDHYLTGVVYPEEHLQLVQGVAAAVVLTSWIGLALARRPANLCEEPRR